MIQLYTLMSKRATFYLISIQRMCQTDQPPPLHAILHDHAARLWCSTRHDDDWQWIGCKPFQRSEPLHARVCCDDDHHHIWWLCSCGTQYRMSHRGLSPVISNSINSLPRRSNISRCARCCSANKWNCNLPILGCFMFMYDGVCVSCASCLKYMSI